MVAPNPLPARRRTNSSSFSVAVPSSWEESVVSGVIAKRLAISRPLLNLKGDQTTINQTSDIPKPGQPLNLPDLSSTPADYPHLAHFAKRDFRGSPLDFLGANHCPRLRFLTLTPALHRRALSPVPPFADQPSRPRLHAVRTGPGRFRPVRTGGTKDAFRPASQQLPQVGFAHRHPDVLCGGGSFFMLGSYSGHSCGNIGFRFSR